MHVQYVCMTRASQEEGCCVYLWLAGVSLFSYFLSDSYQGEAVRLIEEEKAPRMVQWEGGATYDKIWKKKEVAQVKCEVAACNFWGSVYNLVNWLWM